MQIVNHQENPSRTSGAQFDADAVQLSDAEMERMEQEQMRELQAEAEQRLWATRERAAAQAARSAEAAHRLADVHQEEMTSRLRASAVAMQFPSMAGWLQLQLASAGAPHIHHLV